MIDLLFRLFFFSAIVIVFIFIIKNRGTHNNSKKPKWDQTIQRKTDDQIDNGVVLNAAKDFIEGKGHSVDLSLQLKVCANCEYWCGHRKNSSRQGFVHVADSLEKSKCSNKMVSFPFNQNCQCNGACRYWEKWHSL